jgi:hypothetical protein
MILRVARVPWMVIFLGCLVCGFVPGLNILVIVVGTVAGMMWLFSGICRLFGFLFLRNDPHYQEFRRRKGDPYFDLTLPRGINNDSLAVRWGGKPEPQTEFVPPQSWLWQCNNCGARNRDDQGKCWHCGNGLSNAPGS